MTGSGKTLKEARLIAMEHKGKRSVPSLMPPEAKRELPSMNPAALAIAAGIRSGGCGTQLEQLGQGIFPGLEGARSSAAVLWALPEQHSARNPASVPILS